jgi:hypothetical protein
LLIGAATGLFVRKRHGMPRESGGDTGENARWKGRRWQ